MLLHHNLEDPVIIHLHHNQLLALDSAVQVQVGNLHVRLAFRQAHFEQPGRGHAPPADIRTADEHYNPLSGKVCQVRPQHNEHEDHPAVLPSGQETLQKFKRMNMKTVLKTKWLTFSSQLQRGS
mgnify:CR=1 FL=1|jgi:hypothetical protein